MVLVFRAFAAVSSERPPAVCCGRRGRLLAMPTVITGVGHADAGQDEPASGGLDAVVVVAAKLAAAFAGPPDR
jgi:hypothetical protein